MKDNPDVSEPEPEQSPADIQYLLDIWTDPTRSFDEKVWALLPALQECGRNGDGVLPLHVSDEQKRD
jgi:hypothetical protein